MDYQEFKSRLLGLVRERLAEEGEALLDVRGFIPASSEPGGHACMHIWRLLRGSNAPLLAEGDLTLDIVSMI